MEHDPRLWCQAAGAMFLAFVTLGACVGDDPAPSVVDASTPEDSSAPPSSIDATATDANEVDADRDDASSTDAAVRFCQTVAPPSTGSFFCADFDGEAMDEGWTSFRPAEADGSELGRNPNAFVSAPYSYTPSNAQALVWEEVAVGDVSEVRVRLRHRPTRLGTVPNDANGHVTLLSLRTATEKIEIAFGRDSNVFDTPYEGLFLLHSFFGGPAYQSTVPLSAQPQNDAWYELDVHWNMNRAWVRVNDVVVGEVNVPPPLGQRLELSLGLIPSGEAPLMGKQHFDDLRVQVVR